MITLIYISLLLTVTIFSLPVRLIANQLCLTLGSDKVTVQLFPCGQYAYQEWEISSGDKIALGGYCLDAFPGSNGFLQIQACNNMMSQSWWFNNDGRISSRAQTQGCLATSGTTGGGLYLGSCTTNPTFFSYSELKQPQTYQQPQLPPVQQQFPSYQQQPPQLPAFQQQPPQLPPVQQSYPQLPAFQQTPQLPPVQQTPQLPPVQQQQTAPLISIPQEQGVIQPESLTNQISQQQGRDESLSSQIQNSQEVTLDLDGADHYLCTCIVDANAETCSEAVRAACTVGHLNPAACRQSFSKGDHDKIADEILKVLNSGSKCSKFDINVLRKEAQQRAKNPEQRAYTETLEGTPTKEDHYLCVCLESQSSEKCLSAVKAACLVGHIPSGDCYASITKGDHEGITNHILKLIDAGAGCTQKYKTPPPSQPDATNGGIFNRLIHGKKNEVGAGDRDLCACLDDHESALCGSAIKRACGAGKIPKEDCEVSKSKSYLGGVTRHVLSLIDHGANCPAHRVMTFTNHGCHCAQTWEEDGKTFTSPNNCADPGGKKGFPWCKTFPSEHCAGVGGSIEWDRCDNPKYPVRRVIKDDSSVEDGTPTEADHYLCICLSETSTDEVCVAAVKAACEVGHLPQAACFESFQQKDHNKISDIVIEVLKGGARCQDTLQGSSLLNGKRAEPGETACPPGYYGYPNCKKKVECPSPCSHGATCDYAEGTCQCLPNFVGPTCSQCAEGYGGRHCQPLRGAEEAWTLGQGLVYLFLFGGLAYAAFTAYNRYSGNVRSLTYSKLGVGGSKNGGGGGGSPQELETNLPPIVEDEISLSTDLGSDLGSDIENPPPRKSSPVKPEHNGLAI